MNIIENIGKKEQSSKTKVFAVFFAISAAFGFGMWAGKSDCPTSKLNNIDMALFEETWRQLEENFVDKNKINHQKMVYGAIEGMVAAVDDPYTSFFKPEDSKKFLEDTAGSFEGVGMEIGVKKDQLQVISPLENSPAQKAGIIAGDAIVQINGKSTAGITADEAVDLIRGPKGTEVILTLFREEWKETKDFKLIRAIIQVPSLKWEIKNNDIAYLQLYQFTEKASADFKIAAIDIMNSPAKRIVLDLRNNPGGYLSISQDIAGWFLKKGQIVTVEQLGEKKGQIEHVSAGPSLLEKYPLVILINEGSASASEILAGALRDNRQIKLIGEKSFGKGSVQQLISLRGGSYLKVTIAKWLTPNGSQISEIGLAPDVEIKNAAEDEEKKVDAQLNKAIEIVKELR